MDAKTFVQDFRGLFEWSPQCGSWSRASENCDYGDIIVVSKDCYMCFNSGNCRDVYYCEDSCSLTDCIDCAFCENGELLYECVDCNDCYNSNYCQDCVNCSDIHFSYDLKRCKNCFGCVGLRDKQYYLFNEQCSKEEYEKAVQNFDTEETLKKLKQLKLEVPRLNLHQEDTVNCTGDYIYHCKNCYHCFDTRHSEDSGYITQANLDKGTKDSWDCGPIPTGMDLCYDVAYSHFLFDCKHLYWCGNLNKCEYCTNCFEGENLFGCHYLKNKQGYHILNQKVTKEEFEKLVPEIKRELKEKRIYTLYDLLYKDLTKPVVTIPDDQLERRCSLCSKDFTLIAPEITFYQEHDIAQPIYCPDCRAKQRFNLRNERKMYKRTCDGCESSLITTYKPDSKYIVYCLPCYWKHIG